MHVKNGMIVLTVMLNKFCLRITCEILFYRNIQWPCRSSRSPTTLTDLVFDPEMQSHLLFCTVGGVIFEDVSFYERAIVRYFRSLLIQNTDIRSLKVKKRMFLMNTVKYEYLKYLLLWTKHYKNGIRPVPKKSTLLDFRFNVISFIISNKEKNRIPTHYD